MVIVAARRRRRARIGAEVIEIGFGDVAAEGFGEVFFEVALGGSIVNPECFRADAVGSQLLRHPAVGDWFAVPGFELRTLAAVVEPFDQVAGEDAIVKGSAIAWAGHQPRSLHPCHTGKICHARFALYYSSGGRGEELN